MPLQLWVKPGCANTLQPICEMLTDPENALALFEITPPNCRLHLMGVLDIWVLGPTVPLRLATPRHPIPPIAGPVQQGWIAWLDLAGLLAWLGLAGWLACLAWLAGWLACLAWLAWLTLLGLAGLAG